MAAVLPDGARRAHRSDACVTFEEAWAHRVEGTFAEQSVFFIGKEDLMRNKSAAGRHQDLADLDLLRRF